ncbi:hypothetical protein MYSTI_07631 [Myxococcus stipitatus DSM 14675]|uniref:Outer membrane protein beta-barrel domain-containing protein n=1 Tax=Myxococcus stipitatus (strain DSM 14675 / JCM 12634 / Mx s8) TaxID=1278073 RepID=L7ULM4_MYXSD|nr:hypothetical protein [Myxococcus stipitatus]AGC48903.1 hypothetical protein MYSTI_07631 [Myxococcus stipitatus DSM 14675]
MPSPKAVLGPLLTATLLLGSSHAEARFGKRSSPSSSSGNTSSQDRSRTHPATAIGQEHEAPRGDAPRQRSRPGRSPVSGAVVGPGASAAATSPKLSATSRVERKRDEPVPLLVRLGVQGDVIKEGASMSLFMALEGRRMGLDTRITGMTLEPEAGANPHGKKDRITLLSARVTAALWASSRGRMRVEAGLTSAHAPHVIFVGPSFGASAEACIGRSPLDIEVRLNATPFPHRQVDLSAGMALHLSAFNVRGGWRALYLNDAGHVDGVENEESLVGPYLGVGLTF